ncbi:MAG: TRAP transporter small permease [Candidatus Rokubacteria bacterium]|nr:TRAP transporter small permease [Candidatus Rokubacteria bacterium]
MYELAILVAVVVALMAAATAVAGPVGRALWLVEYALLCGSVVAILFVMGFVCAEVVMRYAFNSPIPGHLEGAELLMPIIVFLALSYTQATRGHVGMDLVLDALSPAARRYATMATLLVSILVCAILAYFSGKNALQLWAYDDVTMTPPYFKTWPAAAAIPLGYGLVSLRMFVQVLHLFDPERFPANEPDTHSGPAVE